MKKIIITILLCTLFSCSGEVKNNTQKQETINNNTESIKDVASQTATGIEVGTGIIQQPISYISNISHTEVGFDGFSLAGNVTPDIEKMEIVWKNNAKTNTYTLQKYQKGSGEFKSNLKQSFGNLEYGENVYQIKAYVGEKVVDEKEYKINYEKKGCEITLKSYYNNGDSNNYQNEFMKYHLKVRSFRFNILGNCENKTITLPGSYTLDNGIKLGIEDWGIFYGGGRASGINPKKSEKISNNANVMMGPYCTYHPLDGEECHGNNVSGYFSSIEFHNPIDKSLTENEMNDTYNKVKFILSNIRELPLEDVKLDEKSVDLSKVQISGDTISFSDKNGIKKSFKIVDYAYFQGGGTFEDIRSNPNTDLTFTKLANGKLYAQIYQGSPMRGGLETKLVFDINTGKVLSKKENDISPEGN